MFSARGIIFTVVCGDFVDDFLLQGVTFPPVCFWSAVLEQSVLEAVLEFLYSSTRLLNPFPPACSAYSVVYPELRQDVARFLTVHHCALIDFSFFPSPKNFECRAESVMLSYNCCSCNPFEHRRPFGRMQERL